MKTKKLKTHVFCSAGEKRDTGKESNRYQSGCQSTFTPNCFSGHYLVTFWEECHLPLQCLCWRSRSCSMQSGKRKSFLIQRKIIGAGYATLSSLRMAEQCADPCQTPLTHLRVPASPVLLIGSSLFFAGLHFPWMQALVSNNS